MASTSHLKTMNQQIISGHMLPFNLRQNRSVSYSFTCTEIEFCHNIESKSKNLFPIFQCKMLKKPTELFRLSRSPNRIEK